MVKGMFSRGNVNLNSAESVYVLNPKTILIGLITGILIQLIVFILMYWGFKATVTGILISIILISLGDIIFIVTAMYISRLYLREEMIDMALLFASYNPQILSSSGPMVENTMKAIKEAKQESLHYADLITQLENLKNSYRPDGTRTNVRQVVSGVPTITTNVPMVTFDDEEQP
jgi:hypothetical protein